MSLVDHAVLLQAGAVTIRDLRPDDLDDLFAIVGDPRVAEHLKYGARTMAQSADILASAIAEARTAPRSRYFLGVADPVDDTVLGVVKLWLDGAGEAEIGCALRYGSWGRGLARAAVTRLVRFAAGSLDVQRFVAYIGPRNVSSVRLVEALGFRPAGRIRDHVRTSGSARDSLVYELRTADWGGATAPGATAPGFT